MAVSPILRDGKALLENAGFAEPSSSVYALSFRTGEFRGKVDEPEQDLPKYGRTNALIDLTRLMIVVTYSP